MTRISILIGLVLLFVAERALAQATTTAAVSTTTNSTPPLTKESDDKSWAFSASAYTYLVSDSREYVQPSFMADRDWLHLEARYNYEALESGSAWVGYNFSVGDKLRFEATPMLGGVVGDTTGIAPGYRFSLAWWKLELSSEGEFVFDTRDSDGNFFYNWSELCCYPVDWFRFGLAIQRTKAYQTDLDIQRGFLVGFSYKKVDFTTYVFNWGWTDPTVVLAVGVEF
jgi:hypothetical protein